MFLQSLILQTQMILESLAARSNGNHVPIGIVVSLTLAWLVWRLWRFTISPWLNPDDPLEVPYGIPSHAQAFFNNSNVLLSNSRNYFGNTKEPFALTLAGSKLYVITKSKDVAEAYRNTHSLSFKEFVQALMRSCGNSEYCVQTMYTPLPKDKEGFPNPHAWPLATLARQMHIHQLYPGDRLDCLEQSFLKWFDSRMHLDKLHETCAYAVRSTSQDIVLPLMDWCSDFFVKAGQDAYFGDALQSIDPELPSTFITFDELSWQVLYQYPDFLASKMRRARDAMHRALKAYIQMPQSQRKGDAWFTKAMENEMRALGISDDDIATTFVTIYWGNNTNTRKAAFWLIAYMLQSPDLIEVVRRETGPAFQADGSIDLEHLHHRCPQLGAMWNEMIRLSAYSSSVRFVTEDTVIGGVVLRKGNRLMIPYRQLHFDPAVFGPRPETFEHERFLQKENLTQSSNWRPFGGGTTMCPGRYVAKRSVLVFVAMLFQRFDVGLDGDQPLPAAEEGKPVLGIMSIKKNQDLRVQVKPRTKPDVGGLGEWTLRLLDCFVGADGEGYLGQGPQPILLAALLSDLFVCTAARMGHD